MILDKAAAVVRKDVLTAVRYRNGFIFNLVAPAVQLATFYYLSRAVGPQFRPEGMPYFSFLLVGTGLYTFLAAGSFAFLHTIQEAQQSGTLEVMMTTSTSPAALLSLSALSAFSGAFVQLAIYLGVGTVLFAPGLNANFPGCALILVLSLFIAAGIGMIAAALQISTHKGSAVLWALGSTSWLLAGTLFPVAILPPPGRMLSEVLPFTHSLTAMRLAMAEPVMSQSLRNELGLLLFFAFALLFVGISFFSWTVRRARQMGTLSFY
jgi:ABC-2 type transport system permease protein